MKEIWKDVKGYEGLYQVSNLGRVKSFKRKACGKLMKERLGGNGYLSVVLFKNSSRKQVSIHRLVAEAFISNHENKPQVNHIDENKANNMVSNLEWSTAKENTTHGTRTERAGKAISKSNSIPIIVNNLKTGESQEFNSTKECARQLRLDPSSISHVLKGRYKQTGGYTFKYLNEGDNK